MRLTIRSFHHGNLSHFIKRKQGIVYLLVERAFSGSPEMFRGDARPFLGQ